VSIGFLWFLDLFANLSYQISNAHSILAKLKDVIKTAIARLSFVMAQDLLPHTITALALAPGWMRTEDMLSGFNTDEEHFRQTPLADTESPRYIGRAVVALASDEDVIKKAGKTLLVGSLAREYNFIDIDGTQANFYGE